MKPSPDQVPTDPMGYCGVRTHQINYTYRIGVLPHDANRFGFCLDCDKIPLNGWPVRERGWARRQNTPPAPPES